MTRSTTSVANYFRYKTAVSFKAILLLWGYTNDKITDKYLSHNILSKLTKKMIKRL